MGLADGIEGARYWAQEITWQDEDGTAQDLTGASLSGFVASHQTGTTRAIDGTLTPDADQVTNKGKLTWAYGTNDVGESGDFEVQLVADFSPLLAKTLLHSWKVHRGLSVV